MISNVLFYVGLCFFGWKININIKFCKGANQDAQNGTNWQIQNTGHRSLFYKIDTESILNIHKS